MTQTRRRLKPVRRKAHQPGRPSRQAAEQITQHLLDVALLLFTKQGFAATSIDQIAEECHSSKHTLYRRYKTKTELLAAVVDMARERVFRIVLEPRQADVRAILALRRACDQILERITEAEYVDFYRVCLAEGRNFPQIANKVVAGPNPVVEGVEHLVLKAQEQGDLRAGDACFMGRQLLYLVATIPTFRLMLQSKEFDTAEKRRAYIEKTWDLFMQGVQPRP